MIILQENEKEFIKKYLDESLLEAENVNDILLPLDEWIAVYGLDENYDLTDEGRVAQRIYDNIYLNNSTEE